MTSRCRSPENGPQQPVDLVPRLRAGHAVPKLELHEPDQQGVERPSGREELLHDVAERPTVGDHRGERGDLAGRALSVPDRGAPIVIDVDPGHDRTKTAPVIPAAA